MLYCTTHITLVLDDSLCLLAEYFWGRDKASLDNHSFIRANNQCILLNRVIFRCLIQDLRTNL